MAGRHVVLGVTGGIACYKACTVARRLTEAGALVDVVMTASAAEFIRPVTFEALTGRPVVASLWEPGRALDHVRLGRDPDLIIVAPATARLIARAAQGLADDFLTSLLLARRSPLLLCPAMNDQMYAHPETQANLKKLKSSRVEESKSGVTVLGPATGPLAHGEGEGPGRMVEPEEIVAHAERLLLAGPPFAGKRVLVTAGPTREALDPVRVVTNRSSGRMGYAVARAAWRRGAEVTLISGPGSLEPPFGVEVIRVESTGDLNAAVGKALPKADVLVMAAAPADYRPETTSATKMKRGAGGLRLDLEPTADVLGGTVGKRKRGAVIVGFALESGDPVGLAREKLAAKELDLVVANDATEPGSGPDAPTNRVALVSKDGVERLPLMSKDDVAEHVVDHVGVLLSRRG
ncbi:MAG: bifunctional phosphopantothenoylcysteine decarboxylase/phosphopantothenate--cysteine ligase CoaBC [Gemmatimonadetes bacterium]|nr:bifunctional phosphopantothenoylcysteine decarboxylase/phosphopantothenate--cysteine ligase CoaBC [Gemmatimonadota bacterium]